MTLAHTRIADLEATLAKLTAADGDPDAIDTVREMIAAYRAALAAPVTPAELFDHLREHGFTPADEPFTNAEDAFDRGPVRVVIDDGAVIVYRFTDDRARLLTWSATFDLTAPAAVIYAAIDAAIEGK